MCKKFSFVSFTLLFSLLLGCFEEVADLSNPKTYNSNQIFFKYPRNWQITDDTFIPAIHNLLIETPGDALVIIQSYQVDLAQDLESFSKSFSEDTLLETPVGRISQSEFEPLSKEEGFEWVEENFEISILSKSIPHKRTYGTTKIADRQVFLIFQVASEDHSKAEPGFNLIRNSLRASELK